MGTRSITRVHDAGKDSKVILAVYRQMDGYFEGMGADLTTFLTDMSVVNGINLGKNPKKAANGMSCLAAQLVAHFKTGIGGIYFLIDCFNQFHRFWIGFDFGVSTGNKVSTGTSTVEVFSIKGV